MIQGRSGGAGERSPQPVHARLTEISRPYPKSAESEPISLYHESIVKPTAGRASGGPATLTCGTRLIRYQIM
ncbi:MAG TPA: hypothetical protein VHZ54_17765 [Solirubrobacterales bacterium]|nr:hypothetical protein [Solirubrobacterales bacterium]